VAERILGGPDRIRGARFAWTVRKRPSRYLALTAACLMALGAVAGCSSSSSSTSSGSSNNSSGSAATPLKIGALVDLSGACSGTGPPILDGMKIAAEQLNGTSGVTIGGKKYEIQISDADTQSANVPAVAAAQQLINSDGVKVILGPTCSAFLTQGIAPVAQKANVIYIDNGPLPGLADPATAIATAKQYPDVWLDSPRTAAAAAGYAEGAPAYFPNAKRVFILDDPGGDTVASGMATYLESLGDTVKVEVYPFNTTDFTPYLTKVEAFKPSLLLYGATEVESLAILKQAVTLNAAPAYYTVNGSCCQDPVSNAIGKPITAPWAGLAFPFSMQFPTSAKVLSIKAALTSMGGLGPEDSFAVVGYDQVSLIIQAMQRAGTADDVAAIDKAFATGSFTLIEGGSGITFDAGHAPSKSSQDICEVLTGKVTCKNFVYPPSNFHGDQLTG
jgi:branched-chain amino acid transport system substrate-binding protein